MSISLETLALARKYTDEHGGGGSGRPIYYGTTAYWNAQTGLVSEEGAIYIYSDASSVDGGSGNTVNIPGMKIGDGAAYVVDLPFMSGSDAAVVENHIADSDMHTTSAEKDFWNNKVSAGISQSDPENLVLTNN